MATNKMATNGTKPGTGEVSMSKYMNDASELVRAGKMKLADALNSAGSSITSSVNSWQGSPNAQAVQATTLSTIGRMAAYLSGILIIIIIISLLIHYFITPVYSLHPGAPGLITVPGFDDGSIFWNGSGSYPGTSSIKNEDLPIVNSFFNYSLIVDIFIQNPMQFSKHPRIILSRGAVANPSPSGDTITGILSNYNVAVALQPNPTDMIVSVLNTNNMSENVKIENAPVQEPFRLGIIVMETAMEVYINGNLVKTRKYDANLKDVKGDINPASGVEIGIAKMQNLKIWPRILSSPEIAQAQPPMATATSFGAGPIPTSSSCSALSRMNVSNAMNSANSMFASASTTLESGYRSASNKVTSLSNS